MCVCVCRFFPMSAKVLTEWEFPSQFGHVKCCFSLGHFTSCEDRAATTIIVKLSLVLPFASRSYHGCLSMCQPLVGKWWLIQKGKIESQFEMHSQGQIYLMYFKRTSKYYLMSCQSSRNKQRTITSGNTKRRKDSLWILNCSNLVNRVSTWTQDAFLRFSLTLQEAGNPIAFIPFH